MKRVALLLAVLCVVAAVAEVHGTSSEIGHAEMEQATMRHPLRVVRHKQQQQHQDEDVVPSAIVGGAGADDDEENDQAAGAGAEDDANLVPPILIKPQAKGKAAKKELEKKKSALLKAKKQLLKQKQQAAAASAKKGGGGVKKQKQQHRGADTVVVVEDEDADDDEDDEAVALAEADEEDDEAAAHATGASDDDGAEEQQQMKRQAQLILAKERGRVKSAQKLQSDRVRLADRVAEVAHNGHEKMVKKAKSKVKEAKDAFAQAEVLMKAAQKAARKSKKAHEAAEKAGKVHDKEHDEMVKRLKKEEKAMQDEQHKDVLLAQKELDRAQAAHDAAVMAEKQAQLQGNREQVLEEARRKVHSDFQRGHLEEIALQRVRSEDLLRDDHALAFQKARDQMDEAHQSARDQMHGVPIPAGAPLSNPRHHDIEEYVVPADSNKDTRGNSIDCPKYNGLQCGGPSRGKCDRMTGTCQCSDGVGATGGYFGVACECGWAKNKCNPPECHWCTQMNVCVKDRQQCFKKPHGREGPLGQIHDHEVAGEIAEAKKVKSESVENEHHVIVAPHNGLHDHSQSAPALALMEAGEKFFPQPSENDNSPENSTGIIIAMCLLLFVVVLVIGAYVGFAPKGKSREDNPMSALDLGTAADKSAARRRQATRDD